MDDEAAQDPTMAKRAAEEDDVAEENGGSGTQEQEETAAEGNAAAEEGSENEEAEEEKESDDEDDDLDEDDLDLIAENTGRKISRTKFKRLKRRAGDDDEAASDDEEIVRQPKRPATALQDLFDDEEAPATKLVSRKKSGEMMDVDEDEEEGQIVGGVARDREETSDEEEDKQGRPSFTSRFDARREEQFLDDEDDLNDFIVDDEEGAGERIPREQMKESQRRRAAGGSSVAAQLGIPADIWEEVFEVFGDGSDYAWALGPVAMDVEETANGEYMERELPAKKIEDIFEPAEVAEKMFTDRDDEIRNTDLPERFQLRDYPHQAPKKEELDMEVDWITQKFIRKNTDIANMESFTGAIGKILTFLRIDGLEAPFIIRHRKDIYDGYLQDQDVWDINDLDERWNHMAQRRAALNHWAEIDPSLHRLLRDAADEDAMRDISDYLQVRYRKEMEKTKDSEGDVNGAAEDNAVNGKADTTRKLKRPVRSDMYTLAKEANLHEFAKKFCISSSEFSRNFSDATMHVSPEDPEVSPTELAKDFIGSHFTRPELVLKATRNMIAQEIASEPIVRAVLRISIFEESTISVRPTERGRAEIDEFHEYYPMKYIQEQPLKKFRKDDYLWLHKAEKEGLLNVRINSDLTNINSRVDHLFLGFNTSEIAEQWKEERRLILRQAFQDILLPQVQRWIADKLLNDATEYVIDECRSHLRRKVNQQPYRKMVENEDFGGRTERSSEPSRICAISCGDGNVGTAAFAVYIDSNGDVVDHLKMSSIHGRDQDAKQADCEKLTQFLRGSSVDMVVVSGWNMQTRHLFETIRDCASAALGNIPVIFGNDEVARIYRNSKRGQDDFPAYSPLLKYCISVARTAQEPMFEYACLFNVQRDVLYLKMHPLQDMVPQDRLYASVERVMIDTVNLVGIDVNDALTNARIALAMQFICGLGPRKAPMILTRIKSRCNTLENRGQLVHEIKLGKCVFVNCASFLKISADFASNSYDVLDGTRIHPEDYSLARKMANDALENVTQLDGNESMPVAEIMMNPDNHHALMDLELDDFADQLFREKGHQKRVTLRVIAEEILAPYGEKRQAFREMSVDDVFAMITGETERTLHYGMVVNAVVRKKTEKVVFVNLDSGLDGMVSAENISERLSHTRTAEISAGQGLRGVVTKVDKERFLVELDARENSIQRAAEGQSRQNPYFDSRAERMDRENISNAAVDNGQMVTRSIQHPLFHNFDSRASEKYLSKRPPGDLVFRPSSRGKNSITLTWKVAEGVYQHVQIAEHKKDNEFTLGKELLIGSMKYSDLDQIQAMYVEPMAHRATRLMKHPKFEPKYRDELNAKADRDMLANPSRIPYYLGFSREAGKFILVYKFNPSEEARQETITLMPDGYRFRNQVFTDIADLIMYFKEKGLAGATGGSGPQYPPPPPQQQQQYPSQQQQQQQQQQRPVPGMMRPMPPPPNTMMAPYNPNNTNNGGPGYAPTPSPYYQMPTPQGSGNHPGGGYQGYPYPNQQRPPYNQAPPQQQQQQQPQRPWDRYPPQSRDNASGGSGW